ncbi:hypothetical protein Hsw_1344 [Hymenobacter swuensis DY53]|uniref:Uncharacterized protein n=1 Tax=Hymenobacter swuensis DY53 TaxID=1227739 RepID=W8EUR7_9BACT|nr:hypothetical protein Hsw_1344 [Hymenobacter swuensis DY53]
MLKWAVWVTTCEGRHRRASGQLKPEKCTATLRARRQSYMVSVKPDGCFEQARRGIVRATRNARRRARAEAGRAVRWEADKS